jgi:hypothetical protein
LDQKISKKMLIEKKDFFKKRNELFQSNGVAVWFVCVCNGPTHREGSDIVSGAVDRGLHSIPIFQDTDRQRDEEIADLFSYSLFPCPQKKIFSLLPYKLFFPICCHLIEVCP